MPRHNAVSSLSRRERQIMDALFALGEATVTEIRDRVMPGRTTEATRSALWLLESRQVVTHRVEGGRNVYRPAMSPLRARVAALRHLASTFFGGSRSRAAVALLEADDESLDDEALDRLEALIAERRRARGRASKK